MDAEDFLAAFDVGQVHGDLAVEAAGAEQGGVEHVGAVGGGDDDHAFLGVEAVHLDEQLVERLLAFVVAAAHAVAAVAADGVDFIDEDEAGRVFSALFEHVADAGGADADEHFDEVGAGDGEERHSASPAMALASRVLPVPGEPTISTPLGIDAAEPLEFLGVAQEIDDFLDFFLGLLDAGDVLEGDLVAVHGEQAGLALAEAHGAAAGHFICWRNRKNRMQRSAGRAGR